MNRKIVSAHLVSCVIVGCLLATAAHASAARNPCAGPSALLALLDRPTISDSSCVVPNGKTVLEAGVARGKFSSPPGGRFDTLPNAELRAGLADNNELVWLPPNFQYQRTDGAPGTAATNHGFGATVIGLKHEIGYDAHWQWTVEGLATLPSGSSFYGSHGAGAAFNGIVSYSPGGPFGVSLMLGATSQTEPTSAGGQRYQSINPDVTVTWQLSPRLQFYGEVYAQTHTAPGQNWGSDADGGVQYLVSRHWEVDLEEGVRLQGNLGGFTRYTGAGFGTLF
ncbi:MAG: transporter [Acidiferrobacteraceae bacterium]